MGRHAHELTGARRLCLAGGVALNCVANGRLLREGPFEELWIQPAAGDAGGALGAALDAHHTYFERERAPTPGARALQAGSLWGPGFSGEEIEAFLQTHGYPYRMLQEEQRAEEAARQIAAGKVVGHFAGRMEFGPRALGGRSILGDPRNEDMQATLNLKIKYRESFRPFAPTVLAECAPQYFELACESPYMLLVAAVRPELRRAVERAPGDDLTRVVKQRRSEIPAVTHVDYSARVQTIAREDHPPYYDLIEEFRKLTDCGVIVNTSFNVRGEPIVCTPHDAYRCFMRTEMDVLLLGNALLLKEDQPAWPEAKGHVERDDEPDAENPIPPALLRALRRLYVRDFLPAATHLSQTGGVRITREFRKSESTWAQHRSPATDREIFAIPAAWDSAEADPREVAAAIRRHWAPGRAGDTLQSIVTRLLELGRRFQDAAVDEERISDSVYVLY
jgi:carbamoyltransferase